jgi:uncharacterized protein YdbL (DUF1318 family)
MNMARKLTGMHRFSIGTGAALCLLLAAGVAQAADLDQARAAGLVCEQPDGYAKAVDGSAADIVALVTDVNEKRQAQYAALAVEKGYAVALVISEVWEQRLKQFACK